MLEATDCNSEMSSKGKRRSARKGDGQVVGVDAWLKREMTDSSLGGQWM